LSDSIIAGSLVAVPRLLRFLRPFFVCYNNCWYLQFTVCFAPLTSYVVHIPWYFPPPNHLCVLSTSHSHRVATATAYSYMSLYGSLHPIHAYPPPLPTHTPTHTISLCLAGGRIEGLDVIVRYYYRWLCGYICCVVTQVITILRPIVVCCCW
jgi:hypothetical protein